MKATAIEVTAEHATVELRPCLLARWLGARTYLVRLDWRGVQPAGGWFAAGTGRQLAELEHRDLIREALDFRPVEPLPRAVLR